MSDYQKIVETRYKPIAELFSDLESKPVSYNQVALKFGKEWVNLSHQQARALTDYIDMVVYQAMEDESYAEQFRYSKI